MEKSELELIGIFSPDVFCPIDRQDRNENHIVFCNPTEYAWEFNVTSSDNGPCL